MDVKKTVNQAELAELEPLGKKAPWKSIISSSFDFNSDRKIKELAQDLVEFVRYTLDTVNHRQIRKHLSRDLRLDSDRE